MKEIARAARFAVNGLVAAGVHFTALYLLVEVVRLPSAGLANLMAAIVGATVSFIGNRHFVFRATTGRWQEQALGFAGLYALTALMHGVVLLGWTDLGGWDYRLGFLLATGLQVIVSYLGNRRLVFRVEG